jgi:hypothetical protein
MELLSCSFGRASSIFAKSLIGLAVPALVFAQASDKLCQTAANPTMPQITLQWDSFNDFGNSKSKYTETGFKVEADSSSCKIRSVRTDGRSGERPCAWTPRSSCDLQLGKDAISHKFSTGNVFQYGKLQWVSNETVPVKVKHGDAISEEMRTVAVVKFDGTWSRGSDRGRSVSTAYFDRDWGVLLKIEGAHDANKWGDLVSMIEFPQ